LASGDNFFGKQTAASKVKSEIVLNHFDSWSNIVIGQAAKLGQNIAYMDLYCGPGIYDNGAKSTPILVLEKAIEKAATKPAIAKHLVTIFNDKKAKSVETLEAEVKKLTGLTSLKNPPILLNEKVNKDTEGRKDPDTDAHVPRSVRVHGLDARSYRGGRNEDVGMRLHFLL